MFYRVHGKRVVIGAEIGHACRLQDDSGFKDRRSHRNRATMSSIGRRGAESGQRLEVLCMGGIARVE